MRALRVAWILVLGGLVGGGFYFLLIDTASLPEVLVLAGVAVGCAVAFGLSREQGFAEASIGPWWLLRGWRVMLKIPLDIGTLCWEAIAQLDHNEDSEQGRPGEQRPDGGGCRPAVLGPEREGVEDERHRRERQPEIVERRRRVVPQLD